MKGGYSIGVSQVGTGFANVDRRLPFSAKQRYLRLQRQAKASGKGFHGRC